MPTHNDKFFTVNVEDFIRGDTQFFEMKVKDNYDQLLDLTGYSIAVRLKKRGDLTPSNYTILYTPPANTNTEQGLLYLHAPASLTSLLEPGFYKLEIQLSWDGGLAEDIVHSFQTTFRVLEDIIRVPEGV